MKRDIVRTYVCLLLLLLFIFSASIHSMEQSSKPKSINASNAEEPCQHIINQIKQLTLEEGLALLKKKSSLDFASNKPTLLAGLGLQRLAQLHYLRYTKPAPYTIKLENNIAASEFDITPDGRYLAALVDSKKIRFWVLKEQRMFASLATGGMISALRWDSSGNHLAYLKDGTTVCIRRFSNEKNAQTCIATFTVPLSTSIIWAKNDTVIEARNRTNITARRNIFEETSSDPKDPSYYQESPNGSWRVEVMKENKLQVINTKSKTSFVNYVREIPNTTWDPKSQLVAMRTSKHLTILDAATNTEIDTIELPNLLRVEWNPSGDILAILYEKPENCPRVKLWYRDNKTLSDAIIPDKKPYVNLKWINKELLDLTTDIISIWNVSTGDWTRPYQIAKEFNTCPRFSSDGSLMATVKKFESVQLWDINNPKAPSITIVPYRQEIWGWSDDNSSLITYNTGPINQFSIWKMCDEEIHQDLQKISLEQGVVLLHYFNEHANGNFSKEKWHNPSLNVAEQISKMPHCLKKLIASPLPLAHTTFISAPKDTSEGSSS